MKYKIGDIVYWVESSSNMEKTIPCPICFGKRFVIIILGDDTQEKIECGYCSHGIERATGYIKTWLPCAMVKSDRITGVSSRYGIKYELSNRQIEEQDIFDNEKDAEIEKEIRYKQEVERSQLWFKESFVSAKKSQVWSVGYHKNEIKRNQRTIEWHQERIGMIKVKSDEK